MKKGLLGTVLICAILLSSACKSKAPARTSEPPNTQSGSSSTPAVTQPVSTTSSTTQPSSATPATTQPVSTTPVATQPSSTTTPSVSQPSGTTGTNIGSGGSNASGLSGRHQSGVILDGAVSYTVKSGDTLTSIARQFYKDGSYYPLIMMVSSGISDIDKIYPNMRFTIPNLNANINDPTAKANINRYFLQIADIEEQRGRRETATLIRNHVR